MHEHYTHMYEQNLLRLELARKIKKNQQTGSRKNLNKNTLKSGHTFFVSL